MRLSSLVTATRVRLFLWITAALSLSAVIFLGYEYVSYQHAKISEAKANLKTKTKKAADDIDKVLRVIMKEAAAVAADLESGRLPKDDDLIKGRIAQVMKHYPYISFGDVLFRPYAFAPDQKLHSHFTLRCGEELQCSTLESRYDYTQKDWYRFTMQNGGNWQDPPVYGEASANIGVSYHLPFRLPAEGKGVYSGIVGFRLTLDQVKQIVEAVDLGIEGYPAVTSAKGYYLYHPTNEYVLERKTILDVAREKRDQDRLKVGTRLGKGERVFEVIEHKSLTTGLRSWLACCPIPAAGWSLQNTFVQNDIPMDPRIPRRMLMQLGCAAGVFIVSLILILLRVEKGESRRLWQGSTFIAVLLLIGVWALWEIALSHDPAVETASVAIDRGGLNQLKQNYDARSRANNTPPPVYVPTGVYVESITFPSEDAAIMTGYVWQKFRNGLSVGSREFIFPGAEDVAFKETYRQNDQEYEVVRTHFQAKVHTGFRHRNYPLDRETVSLRIRQKDLNHNVLLVPDLGAYNIINPSVLPGLDGKITVPGWELEKTYFSLAENRCDTNFGLTLSVLKERFPAFKYNIVIKRNFLDAFMSHLTPLIVVAVMLFALLITTTCSDELQQILKTGAGTALSMSSGLFFVVVFSHIGVRQRIRAAEVFYLEQYYFVMYLTVLWILTSVVAYSLARESQFFRYRDNLVSKLLYWPSLLGIIFLITLVTFY